MRHVMGWEKKGTKVQGLRNHQWYKPNLTSVSMGGDLEQRKSREGAVHSIKQHMNMYSALVVTKETWIRP